MEYKTERWESVDSFLTGTTGIAIIKLYILKGVVHEKDYIIYYFNYLFICYQLQ
jgi:hypothetical protein